MKDNTNGRVRCEMAQMEDKPNGRQPKWKTTQMEDDLDYGGVALYGKI